MSNTVLLGDIASLKTGPFGTQLSASEYVNDGIPVINVRNIGYGEIITSDLEYVGEGTAQRLHEHLLCKGDIVFGRKGSVDRHAFIDNRYDGWMQGSDCIRVRVNEGINPHFVSHYLKLESVKKQINSSAVGSTMASLNTDILGRIQIVLPSLEIQNRVEELLSVIEEKIDLNTRLCAELEAMAKTLYDYWFVQFDFPDENGKPYRTSGGAMEWCQELGREVPKGWKAGALSDLVNSITLSVQPGENLYGLSYTPIDALPMRSMSFYGGQDYREAKSSLQLYNENDILIGAMRVYFHRVCIAAQKGITRTTTIVLRSKNQDHLPYIYQVFNEDKTIEYANRISTGTQQPYVTWNNSFEKMTCLLPSDKCIKEYSIRMQPVIEKVKKLNQEKTRLVDLRDWLLPMLMNGQARIEP